MPRGGWKKSNISSSNTPGSSIQFCGVVHTYGAAGGKGTSQSFDCNRPSAAKSAGTVGKWGIASFTSLRTSVINDSAIAQTLRPGNCEEISCVEDDAFQFNSDTPIKAPTKTRKFFKSRADNAAKNNNDNSQPLVKDVILEKTTSLDSTMAVDTDIKNKKFFSSPNVQPMCQEDKMPTLRLKICRNIHTGNLTSSHQDNVPIKKRKNETVFRDICELNQDLDSCKVSPPSIVSSDFAIDDHSAPTCGVLNKSPSDAQSCPDTARIMDDNCVSTTICVSTCASDVCQPHYVPTPSLAASTTDTTNSKVYCKGVKDRRRYEVCSTGSEIDLNEKCSQFETHGDVLPEKPIINEANVSDPFSLAASVEVPRKGLIFKSRGASSRTTRATYKHIWMTDQHDEGTITETASAETDESRAIMSKTRESSANTDTASLPLCEENDTQVAPYSGLLRHTQTYNSDNHLVCERNQTQCVIGVKCPRAEKGHYTVIKNVKSAYEIQEIGEFQEYTDDVEYIKESLQPINNVATRCLSAMRLAMKCTAAPFRMHLRAHGSVCGLLTCLCDAPTNPSLALCAACVFLVLSVDQLNMDIDSSSLELLISLLRSDMLENSDCLVEYNKHKLKVSELCACLQQQGHLKELNTESVSASYLAMETLLSLTSQRAGSWFKEELRRLHGLDHLLETVSRDLSSLTTMWRDSSSVCCHTFVRTTRCLRVIENVTNENEDNQRHIISSVSIVDDFVSFLELCDQLLASHLTRSQPEQLPTIEADYSTLNILLRVLINCISANNAIYSLQQNQGHSLVKTLLRLVLETLPAIQNDTSSRHTAGSSYGDQPSDSCSQQFESCLLVYSFLILLTTQAQPDPAQTTPTEYNATPNVCGNQWSCCDAISVRHVQLMMQQFWQLLHAASEVETHTDRIIDTQLDKCAENTASALIQKAGHHMEKTVIGAYIVVVIIQLAMTDKRRGALIRECLQSSSYQPLINIVSRVCDFFELTQTNKTCSREMKVLQSVIEYMKKEQQASSAESAFMPVDMTV